MKFQQLSMDFVQLQLMEGRKYSGEEICRWFGVPPILAYHSDGTTTWGSGIEQIIEAWHKLDLRPELVAIEQSFAQQVMTVDQRATMKVEFELDALLRGSTEQRVNTLVKQIAGGLITPNEARQLQNNPPVDGADVLLGPVNTAPIHMLGKISQPKENGASNGAA
jgi:HK97 family phage portal protein